jgi:hypothetical protein
MQLPPISLDRVENFNYVHKKNIMDTFIDLTPPKDIAQIYKSSISKLKDIKKSLDALEFKYNYKNQELYTNPYSFNDFYQRYARPLNRLRIASGIDYLNSSDKVKHLIKIVDNNLKIMRRKKRHKQKWKRVANVAEAFRSRSHSEASHLPISEDETDEKEGKGDVIDLRLYYQRSDSVIGPIIQELKEESLNLTYESFDDLQSLGDLYDKSLDSVENYTKIIDELEKINNVYGKYFKSFYNKNQVSQFLLKFYDSKRASIEKNSTVGTHDLSNEDYENKLMNLLDTTIKYDEQIVYFVRKIKAILKKLRKILRQYVDEDYYDEEEELETENALHGNDKVDLEQKKLLIQRNLNLWNYLSKIFSQIFICLYFFKIEEN